MPDDKNARQKRYQKRVFAKARAWDQLNEFTKQLLIEYYSGPADPWKEEEIDQRISRRFRVLRADVEAAE